VSGAVSNAYGWFVLARDIVASARDRVGMLLGSISPLWLYGGAALVATSYAALAAFGAATYRVLSAERSPS
jgi:hypothetical protein